MKNLSQRASILVSALLTVGALTVFAKTSPTFDIHTSVISKAAQSEKGVILVLTGRGAIAAYAAHMLSMQIKQNEGFAPLLMAVEDEKLAGYMTALALPAASLPAVIFFNKSGKELGRVVAVKSVITKRGQPQEHVI